MAIKIVIGNTNYASIPLLLRNINKKSKALPQLIEIPPFCCVTSDEKMAVDSLNYAEQGNPWEGRVR